jgi:hypothetical protein
MSHMERAEPSGMASGSLPNGKYQRVWFKEMLQPEEVAGQFAP